MATANWNNMKKHFKKQLKAKDIETSKNINIMIINEARKFEFYSELSQMLKYEPEIYGWFWMMAEAKETETKETGTKAKEVEAKETGTKVKKTETKAKETETKAKETETKAKEVEVEAKEVEAK
jgi:hypothetical protein